jgi:hypothetical protein
VGNRSAGVGVSGLGAAVAAGAGQNATMALLQDEVAALRRDFVSEIKSLKMSAAGKGPFRIGTHTFDGYASCECFCRTHDLDKNFFYDFILAPHSMLASLANTTLTLEEYTDTAILTTKTSLTPNQLCIKECWEFCLVTLQVWCQETAEARTVAHQINTYKDPLQANALALQAAVGELQVHHTFKTFCFQEHPRIFPKFQTQFIKRCVLRQRWTSWRLLWSNIAVF